jgi:hypothetical protein
MYVKFDSQMKMKCILLLQDGTDVVVKEVLPGDSVHSLLSILDVITVCYAFHSVIYPLTQLAHVYISAPL